MNYFFDAFIRQVKSFDIDKETKRFIKHNRKVWNGWDNKDSESVVLVDLYGVNETIIAYSYFLNILARRHNARILSFGPPRKIVQFVLYKIYRSFNASGHIVTSLTREQQRRQREIFQKIAPLLKTKRDIFDLKVLDIWIGIDIYETYLKQYNKPTVMLDDPNLFKKVEEGIGLTIFWQDFFATHKVVSVLVSHDTYLHLDIICKIAYRAKIPVYLINTTNIAYLKRPFTSFSYFEYYKQMFRKLTIKEQQNAIDFAGRQLQRTLNGEINVDRLCATRTAFGQVDTQKRILKESKNIKVLICTHCFYDNPHGYGGMLFLDFYEWLYYLGKISERTNYDWYLKTHPNPLPGTPETIEKILADFPKINIIPSDTSHHQLVKERIDFILTVYGSVGEECPALGVQVINAAYNPRLAYDFNWHPKSLEEYEYYLLNLDKLPKKEINLEEVYEFYYMQHYYTYVDNLIFKSYRQLLSDLTKKQRMTSRVFKYFLDQLSDTRHQEIISKLSDFIYSGKQYYFSYGPENIN